MKKLILFAAILFAGVSVVNAQQKVQAGAIVTTDTHLYLENGDTPSGNESTADTELKVTLSAIQSISLNTANIHLKYQSVDDYEKGLSTGPVADHIKVYSTGGFIVNVKYDASTADDTYSEETPDIMFSTIKLDVTDNNGKGLDVTDHDLTSSDTPLITSTAGGFAYTYSVDYKGLGGKAYLDFIKGGEERVFTADVIYTIVAQ